jgi:nitrogen regulatory protein P-II 1
MISVLVSDNLVTDIVNKILDNTSSGLAGEGKVFVSDVDESVDIGTCNRGESAL